MKFIQKSFLVLIAFGFIFGAFETAFGQNKAGEKPELKTVFDEYKVDGAFVLYDLKQKKYVRYNSARARQKFLPLSTFKIPNSLIRASRRMKTTSSNGAARSTRLTFGIKI